MAKLKPIERLAGDVKEGDLIRIQCGSSERAGYFSNLTTFSSISIRIQFHGGDKSVGHSQAFYNPRGNNQGMCYEVLRRDKKH